MRVEWSSEARRDLSGIASFSDAGPTIVQAIILRCDRLLDFPRSGSTVDRYRRARVRYLLEGRYRILYVVGSETITIVGVAHVAQEL